MSYAKKNHLAVLLTLESNSVAYIILMMIINLILDQLKVLNDGLVLELNRIMRRPIYMKIDDGYVLDNCIVLNLYQFQQLCEHRHFKTVQHDTEIEIRVHEKHVEGLFPVRFPADGLFQHEMQNGQQ